MSRFLSKRLASLATYVPGEQPAGGGFVKLNTNESPYEPSPRVIEALRGSDARSLNLYPDPEALRAREAVAKNAGLAVENCLLANGSDEALAFCMQAFCDADSPCVRFDITYGLYSTLAGLYGVPSRVVPLLDDFTVDFDGVKRALAESRGRGAAFITNPNAPTGLAARLDDIEELLDAASDAVIVVDEAYAAFGAQSAKELISRRKNLVIVDTMSKFMSLAGARVGYVLADPELIGDLDRVRRMFNPYNVGSLALAAAEAAAGDAQYYESRAREIAETRDRTAYELARRGFFVLPGRGNFLFAKPRFIDGALYCDGLRRLGVLVRRWSEPARISDFVRVTIGSEDQMRAFLDATDRLIREVLGG